MGFVFTSVTKVQKECGLNLWHTWGDVSEIFEPRKLKRRYLLTQDKIAVNIELLAPFYCNHNLFWGYKLKSIKKRDQLHRVFRVIYCTIIYTSAKHCLWNSWKKKMKSPYALFWFWAKWVRNGPEWNGSPWTKTAFGRETTLSSSAHLPARCRRNTAFSNLGDYFYKTSLFKVLLQSNIYKSVFSYPGLEGYHTQKNFLWLKLSSNMTNIAKKIKK